jgi:hypothetical protein
MELKQFMQSTTPGTLRTFSTPEIQRTIRMQGTRGPAEYKEYHQLKAPSESKESAEIKESWELKETVECHERKQLKESSKINEPVKQTEFRELYNFCIYWMVWLQSTTISLSNEHNRRNADSGRKRGNYYVCQERPIF